MKRKGLRLRAVVLAAGRGERLRPLTEFLPKALLPVAGRAVAERTLSRLAAARCEAAAVNLHHLGGQIRRRLGEAHAGLPLAYFPEAELQGTLGALVPMRDFLSPADLVILVNGDSLCHWPVGRLVRRHLRSGARATLLLSRRADPGAFGGGVGVDRDGRVVSVQPGSEHGEVVRRRVFAGAHVFAPGVLEGVARGFADILADLYEPLLAAGERLQGVEISRPWHDLGTPGRYLAAVLDWGRGRRPRRWIRRSWVAGGVSRERGARVRRSVVEAGVRLGAGARAEGSLLLPGAALASGSSVRGAIVGPAAELPPGTWVERRLVTRERPGVPPRPGDSVVGGLVYSPFPG